MIETGIEDPFFKEFGLSSNVSCLEKTAAVLGKGTRVFATTAGSSFAFYNFLFLFDDLKNGRDINFLQNMKYSASISFNFAAKIATTTMIADSISLLRGKRKFYDSVIGGVISGDTFKIRNGLAKMKRGAINGAMTQLMLESFQFAMQKLSETNEENQKNK